MKSTYNIKWFDGANARVDNILADSWVINEAGRLALYDGKTIKKIYNKEVWLSVEMG